MLPPLEVEIDSLVLEEIPCNQDCLFLHEMYCSAGLLQERTTDPLVNKAFRMLSQGSNLIPCRPFLSKISCSTNFKAACLNKPSLIFLPQCLIATSEQHKPILLMSFFKKHSSPQHSVSRIKTWALN
jgi:hypothetical protein